MEYVLSWQVTVAVFIIVSVILWFLGGLIKMPRIVALLIAAGLSAAAKYYWWTVNSKFIDWLRFLGLDI